MENKLYPMHRIFLWKLRDNIKWDGGKGRIRRIRGVKAQGIKAGGKKHRGHITPGSNGCQS